jgi:hypothetical protein
MEKHMIVFEMTADSKDELIEKLADYQRTYPAFEDAYGTTIKVPLKEGEIWVAQIIRGA